VLTLPASSTRNTTALHLDITVARSYWHHSCLREALGHVRITRELYVRLGAGLDIRQCDELMAALAELG
jgi:hypothetical protein